MYIVASIQARLGSTRLPGKVLYSLGDRRILRWVIDRSNAAKFIDKTVISVGDQAENDAITKFCEREKIEYTVGPEENLLSRHLTVAADFDCDLLVRITADCPFIPAAEIDRTIECHLSNNARYTTNGVEKMPVGTTVDVVDREVLEELKELGESHPVRRLRNNPSEWNIAVSPNEQWMKFHKAHIAVDTPDDYWMLSDAIEAVGDQPRAVVEWVSE